MRKTLLATTLLIFMLSYPTSAFSFPEYVPGADLIAFEGDSDSVKYASPDTRIVAIFARQEITSQRWAEIEQEYLDSGILPIQSSGFNVYYVCELEDNDERCFSDLYTGGYYYTVDISILDPEPTETMDVTEQIIAEANNPTTQTTTPTPVTYKTTTTTQPNEPDNPVCCLPGFLAIISAAAALLPR